MENINAVQTTRYETMVQALGFGLETLTTEAREFVEAAIRDQANSGDPRLDYLFGLHTAEHWETVARR